MLLNGVFVAWLDHHSILSITIISFQEIESIRQDLSTLSSNQKIIGIIVVFLLLLQFMCILNERYANLTIN